MSVSRALLTPLGSVALHVSTVQTMAFNSNAKHKQTHRQGQGEGETCPSHPCSGHESLCGSLYLAWPVNSLARFVAFCSES
ncbi:hypothetical protein B0T26DRAFT_691748 [Lasiosphaeria miniovina]|uniref:Uncharacterized protein n=1 Tax=Lasiosphaeria miniovina TaxID=1954250 RepID=A0AA40B3F9_9PEZI|nr:uncharacterized protein B0T26DRAFT_691748 [Lasiosphaeria miniovina]KAK0726782.1 hypothetical protein B0T26DRAFT_691748 [Lasiosphaeria miniovina]